MRISFANDHAALEARTILLDELARLGIEVVDRGTESAESCDYPDFAARACRDVVEGRADRALLVCGTGIGMSIAANKINGIRCALCTDPYAAQMSRGHNNANALALRGRQIDLELNRELLRIWLKTDFEGGPRHQRRVDKISGLETPKPTGA
jgi:ribose 5-phosphate isomerase B